MPPRRRRTLIAALSLAALPLAACSVSATSSARDGQDGRAGTGQGGMPGDGMMRGGAGGYRWSGSTCPTPTTTPGERVDVVLGDMGMHRVTSGVAPTDARMMLHAVPTRVPHGSVTLVVRNRGWRLHELVVLPLSAGAAAGERPVGSNGRVSEAGSLGEASRDCGAGDGDGIRSGSAGWVTLRLPAGRYELVCNLRNHYAAGMRQEIDVA